MKILVASDFHITRASEFSKPTDDGLTEYLQLCLNTYSWLEDLYKSEKPEAFAFCGDFWDAQDFVDTLSIYVGNKILDSISSWDCTKFAVVGNHDYFSIDHSIYSLNFLRNRGWTVFDDIYSVKLGDYTITGLPFRDSYDDESIKLIANSDLVLAHAEVIGGKRREPATDKDIKAFSSKGLDHRLITSNGNATVLNGHHHHPSEISKNWHNIGSALSRTFADKNSVARGAVIYDLETRGLQRYNNPYNKEFIEVSINSEQDIAELIDKDYSNSYAKIYYNTEYADYAETIEESFAGVRLVPITENKAKVHEAPADDSFSLEDNLVKFISNNYDGNENLIKISTDILKEASSDYEDKTSRSSLDFGWLDITNFQSISSARVNLNNQGLVFIKGINNDDSEQESNGSGKSSLLEAIYWVLTGKSLRGYSVNGIIKWGESYVRCSLELYTANKVYTVIRSRKDPDYGTGVTILEGESNLSARRAVDNSKKLEDILGRSEKSLRHICFMMEDLSHSFTALSPLQRGRLLEEIIDCEPYSICKDIAKSRHKEVSYRLGSAKGSIDSLSESKLNLEARISELEQELLNVESSVKSELDVISRKESTVNKSIQSLTEEIDSKLNEIKEVDSNLANLSTKLDKCDKFKYENIKNVSSLQSELKLLKKEIASRTDLITRGICPTCGAIINGNDFKADNDKDNKTIKHIEFLIAGGTSKINSFKEREVKLKTASKKILDKKDFLSREIRELDFRVSSLNKKLNDYRLEKSKLESKKDLVSRSLSESRKSLEQTQESLLKYLELENSLSEEENNLAIIKNEIFDEKGVRASLLMHVAIPFINVKLPDYSKKLWGGKQLYLNSDLEIEMPDKRSYVGESKGNKRRIDLIFQFILNDLAVATGRSRIGFLALDEVLDSLDEPGIYSVKEVLEDKAENTTIFMVSHSRYAASISQKKIVLSKSNSTTELLSVG